MSSQLANAASSGVSRGLGLALRVLLALAGLYGVMAVYATGQTLLAATLLALGSLALWVYGSARTQAARYLFPGVAAALVFVVFPMLYTVGMGFTNQSSRNLLAEDKARDLLLAERVVQPGSERAFTLHAEADGLRLHLPAQGDAPALLSAPLPAAASPAAAPSAVALQPGQPATAALPLRAVVERLAALRALTWQAAGGPPLTLENLRTLAEHRPLFALQADGALTDRLTGSTYAPDRHEGFFTSASGDRLQPGFIVGVGLRHYARIFRDGQFQQPFLSVFIWTVLFSAGTVLGAAALGLLLAVLLNWEALPGRGVYRVILFLPYAVPGFISILVFKGLFNQNLGEINLILHGLFGIRPAWFSDPLLAKCMLLFVNIWLGFPYMMVLCSGLIKAIPADLYEASAVAGAGPWVNFRRITAPLIVKPLTPLLISAFAFNFNNFVLISLLTGGRPDHLDADLPAGTTDILVSYTWRIAFQDSGQQFGLAAAISTVIFLIVAGITLVQMRFTKLAADEGRR